MSTGVYVRNIPERTTRSELREILSRRVAGSSNTIEYILYPLQDDASAAFVHFSTYPGSLLADTTVLNDDQLSITPVSHQTYIQCTADVDAAIVASIPDLPACITQLRSDYGVDAEYSEDSGRFTLRGSLLQLSCVQSKLSQIHEHECRLQRAQLRDIQRRLRHEAGLDISSTDDEGSCTERENGEEKLKRENREEGKSRTPEVDEILHAGGHTARIKDSSEASRRSVAQEFDTKVNGSYRLDKKTKLHDIDINAEVERSYRLDKESEIQDIDMNAKSSYRLDKETKSHKSRARYGRRREGERSGDTRPAGPVEIEFDRPHQALPAELRPESYTSRSAFRAPASKSSDLNTGDKQPSYMKETKSSAARSARSPGERLGQPRSLTLDNRGGQRFLSPDDPLSSRHLRPYSGDNGYEREAGHSRHYAQLSDEDVVGRRHHLHHSSRRDREESTSSPLSSHSSSSPERHSVEVDSGSRRAQVAMSESKRLIASQCKYDPVIDGSAHLLSISGNYLRGKSANKELTRRDNLAAGEATSDYYLSSGSRSDSARYVTGTSPSSGYDTAVNHDPYSSHLTASSRLTDNQLYGRTVEHASEDYISQKHTNSSASGRRYNPASSDAFIMKHGDDRIVKKSSEYLVSRYENNNISAPLGHMSESYLSGGRLNDIVSSVNNRNGTQEFGLTSDIVTERAPSGSVYQSRQQDTYQYTQRGEFLSSPFPGEKTVEERILERSNRLLSPSLQSSSSLSRSPIHGGGEIDGSFSSRSTGLTSNIGTSLSSNMSSASGPARTYSTSTAVDRAEHSARSGDTAASRLSASNPAAASNSYSMEMASSSYVQTSTGESGARREMHMASAEMIVKDHYGVVTHQAKQNMSKIEELRSKLRAPVVTYQKKSEEVSATRAPDGTVISSKTSTSESSKIRGNETEKHAASAGTVESYSSSSASERRTQDFATTIDDAESRSVQSSSEGRQRTDIQSLRQTLNSMSISTEKSETKTKQSEAANSLTAKSHSTNESEPRSRGCSNMFDVSRAVTGDRVVTTNRAGENSQHDSSIRENAKKASSDTKHNLVKNEIPRKADDKDSKSSFREEEVELNLDYFVVLYILDLLCIKVEQLGRKHGKRVVLKDRICEDLVCVAFESSGCPRDFDTGVASAGSMSSEFVCLYEETFKKIVQQSVRAHNTAILKEAVTGESLRKILQKYSKKIIAVTDDPSCVVFVGDFESVSSATGMLRKELRRLEYGDEAALAGDFISAGDRLGDPLAERGVEPGAAAAERLGRYERELEANEHETNRITSPLGRASLRNQNDNQTNFSAPDRSQAGEIADISNSERTNRLNSTDLTKAFDTTNQDNTDETICRGARLKTVPTSSAVNPSSVTNQPTSLSIVNGSTRESDFRSLPTTTSQHKPRDTRHKFEFAHGTVVYVYTCDITELKIEAIVNAANGELANHAGLARAIEELGGEEFKQECVKRIKRTGSLRTTEVTHTYGCGRLLCDYVLHAVGPMWFTYDDKERCAVDLYNTILNILKYADKKLHLTAIAIPAISSGIFGVPLDLCARAMYSAIRQFTTETKNSSITHIHVVNLDYEVTDLFLAIFQNLISSPSDQSDVTGSSDNTSSRPLDGSKSSDESGSRVNQTGSSLAGHPESKSSEFTKSSLACQIRSELTGNSGLRSSYQTGSRLEDKTGSRLEERTGARLEDRGAPMSMVSPYDEKYGGANSGAIFSKRCVTKEDLSRSLEAAIRDSTAAAGSNTVTAAARSSASGATTCAGARSKTNVNSTSVNKVGVKTFASEHLSETSDLNTAVSSSLKVSSAKSGVKSKSNSASLSQDYSVERPGRNKDSVAEKTGNKSNSIGGITKDSKVASDKTGVIGDRSGRSGGSGISGMGRDNGRGDSSSKNAGSGHTAGAASSVGCEYRFRPISPDSTSSGNEASTD